MVKDAETSTSTTGTIYNTSPSGLECERFRNQISF
jgi:hypothetical protein